MKSKKILSVLLIGLLILSSLSMSFAAPQDDKGEGNQEQEQIKDKEKIKEREQVQEREMLHIADTMYYEGVIIDIIMDNDDISILVDGFSQYEPDEVKFNITKGTKLNIEVTYLEIGDVVGVYHSGAMTTSIPPMTNALAVNLLEDHFLFSGTVFNIQKNNNTLMLKANKGHVYKYEIPENVVVTNGELEDIQKGTTIEIRRSYDLSMDTVDGGYDMITIISRENDEESIEDIYFSVMVGEITEVYMDDDDEIIGILIGDPMYGQYFHINGDTILPDLPLSVGMIVKIGYNGISTMSLPGQSTAEEIIILSPRIMPVKTEELQMEIEGTITSIKMDEKGKITGFLIGDAFDGHFFHIDNKTRMPKDDLEIGMTVIVEFNGIATASLPPQSMAEKITIESEAVIEQGVITEVVKDDMGMLTGIHLGDPYYGHFFHINEDTFLPADTLKVGMTVKIAYNGITTLSMPGQSTADIIAIVEDAPEVTGYITEIITDDEGNITAIMIGYIPTGHYFYVNEDTVLIGDTLEEGMRVQVNYNGISTRSIPPKSTAELIISL